MPLPFFVWGQGGVVRLANPAAADFLGMPLGAVIGQRMIDRFAPREDVARVVDAVFSGALVGAQTKRVATRSDGTEIPVWAYTRVVELDSHRAALTLIVPTSELATLGRDPETPWRDLFPIVVGVADANWTVKSITRDVDDVLGYDMGQLVGRSLLDLVDPDEVGEVTEEGGGPPKSPLAIPGISMQQENGEWAKVCLLVAPLAEDDKGGVVFAMLGPKPTASATSERVAELEMRLRRIGAEVRAAGVIENVNALRPHVDHPELAELTTRQWEILSLLLEGLRVPAIAAHLYLSPSTVRNHLATIFRKFGVHSQSELLELLRRPPDQTEG